MDHILTSSKFVHDPLTITSDHADTMRLADGRRLAWLECGDPRGLPVVFLHGTPDSRFGALIFTGSAKAAGLRVISPDRPGFGKSDFYSKRTLDDWSSDMRQLLDHLNIDRAIIWAISGGGAYGCVMARDLPDRVCGVLSVCGMMPATAGERANLNAFVRFGLFLAKLPAPLGNPLFRAVYRSMAKSNSPATRNRLLKRLPEGSRQDAMEDNLFRFIALSGETNFNAGPAGVRQEMRLYGADAETLDLRKITVPFTIMHGEKDINVPIDIARRVEAAIPHSKAIYYPGEDHTFWWPNRQRMIDEIKLIAAS